MWVDNIARSNPKERSGQVFHSVSYTTRNGEIVSKTILLWGAAYGIKNDFYEYQNDKWNQIDPKIDSKAVRVGGPASCSHKQFIYIFGGVYVGQCGHRFTDQLCRYDAEKRELKVLICPGSPPHGKIGASMVYYNDSLWLFGGCCIAGKASAQLYRCRLDYNRWETVQTNEIRIVPRESQTGNFYRDSKGVPYLVVYGGFSVTYETFDWSNPRNMTGDLPQGRAMHSAAIHGSKLYVFGGLLKSGAYLPSLKELMRKPDTQERWSRTNQLYTFDLERLHWAPVKYLTCNPLERSDHSATMVPFNNKLNNKMLVFGGCIGDLLPTDQIFTNELLSFQLEIPLTPSDLQFYTKANGIVEIVWKDGSYGIEYAINFFVRVSWITIIVPETRYELNLLNSGMDIDLQTDCKVEVYARSKGCTDTNYWSLPLRGVLQHSKELVISKRDIIKDVRDVEQFGSEEVEEVLNEGVVFTSELAAVVSVSKPINEQDFRIDETEKILKIQTATQDLKLMISENVDISNVPITLSPKASNHNPIANEREFIESPNEFIPFQSENTNQDAVWQDISGSPLQKYATLTAIDDEANTIIPPQLNLMSDIVDDMNQKMADSKEIKTLTVPVNSESKEEPQSNLDLGTGIGVALAIDVGLESIPPVIPIPQKIKINRSLLVARTPHFTVERIGNEFRLSLDTHIFTSETVEIRSRTHMLHRPSKKTRRPGNLDDSTEWHLIPQDIWIQKSISVQVIAAICKISEPVANDSDMMTKKRSFDSLALENRSEFDFQFRLLDSLNVIELSEWFIVSIVQLDGGTSMITGLGDTVKSDSPNKLIMREKDELKEELMAHSPQRPDFSPVDFFDPEVPSCLEKISQTDILSQSSIKVINGEISKDIILAEVDLKVKLLHTNESIGSLDYPYYFRLNFGDPIEILSNEKFEIGRALYYQTSSDKKTWQLCVAYDGSGKNALEVFDLDLISDTKRFKGWTNPSMPKDSLTVLMNTASLSDKEKALVKAHKPPNVAVVRGSIE